MIALYHQIWVKGEFAFADEDANGDPTEDRRDKAYAPAGEFDRGYIAFERQVAHGIGLSRRAVSQRPVIRIGIGLGADFGSDADLGARLGDIKFDFDGFGSSAFY